MVTKKDDISLLRNVMVIFMQQMKYITHLFVETWLQYFKFILGTFGLPDHAHQNQWH